MEELNLSTLAKQFSDEAHAWKLMESIRWPNGPVCPHCGNVERSYLLKPRKTRNGNISSRRLWKCRDCRRQLSVLIGTIFERTHVPLSKWLLAIHMMCAGKNGVSAHELHRQLGITLKTAWFVAHRVRYAMTRSPLADKLSGVVESDETYIGGRETGVGPGRPGLGSRKTPILTFVERNGEARSRIMSRVTRENIERALKEDVDPAAILMTDELPTYRAPGRLFAGHETVQHGKREYVRGRAHVNTAEGFFSQLKRSIDGTHHHVSREHLSRYLAEFDYRYSTRKMTDGQRTALTITKAEGKRLQYRETTPA